jgi:hypothetical protein
MTVFTPEWKLTINGVDYTNVAISDISHESGRTDIYQQPNPGYIQIDLVALNNQTYDFEVNDGLALQVKNSAGTYVSLFGGNITDITVSVGATGSVGTVLGYSIIALGSLAKLAKIITTGILSQDDDGDQIYALLTPFLLGNWNDVPAAETWAAYSATETWANAANIGLGEIDQPGQYEMENRTSLEDTVYNIASLIANSAFGYLYEDNAGNIGYADAAHRQVYAAANGFIEISANTAIGSGLATKTQIGDVRNSVAINYGNNFGSQETASDTTSIGTYGYKAETINSVIHDATDAQNVADRYISLRAYPKPNFDSITFPITNPELDDADRDALLGIFIGQPIMITDLPTQIATGGLFEGYVEGWNWSTSFNQLFITINLSPIEFSAVFQTWSDVNALEAWNTLSGTITWQTAIGVIA